MRFSILACVVAGGLLMAARPCSGADIIAATDTPDDPRAYEQCRAHDVSEWMKAHGSQSDAHVVADKLNEIVHNCAKRFLARQLENPGLASMGLTLPEQTAECEHPGTDASLSDPDSTRMDRVAYLKAMNELDKTEFPQACRTRIPGSRDSVVWLRVHLRGGHYGDLPDQMFDMLRPGDGHIVMYMSAPPEEAGAAVSTVGGQLAVRSKVYAQDRGPSYLYALLHYRNGKYTWLPLNYSPSDPSHLVIPPRASAWGSAAYDTATGKYLLHSEPYFLSPSWDPSVPSWEHFNYAWWFDAKTDQLQRLLLPPGPWVADAKLDAILGRAFRNFSCGVDCYRQADIKVDGGEIFVTISGRPSAISKRVMGTYRLNMAAGRWKKQSDSHPEP